MDIPGPHFPAACPQASTLHSPVAMVNQEHDHAAAAQGRSYADPGCIVSLATPVLRHLQELEVKSTLITGMPSPADQSSAVGHKREGKPVGRTQDQR